MQTSAENSYCTFYLLPDTGLVNLTEPGENNNGYILISANGGLNQQRVAVRNLVLQFPQDQFYFDVYQYLNELHSSSRCVMLLSLQLCLMPH
jgi:hypothetical protein